MIYTLRRVRNFPWPYLGAFALFLLFSTAVCAFPSVEFLAGAPSARSIPPMLVPADEPYTIVLNGSFRGEDLRYSATLSNGRSLPFWMKMDSRTGALNVKAPMNVMGQLFEVTVRATDALGRSAVTKVHLTADSYTPDCRIDANTDRMGKVLGCRTRVTRLRGFCSSGNYLWRGPGGFTSTEAEPEVTSAGLYFLTSTSRSGNDCERVGMVRVISMGEECRPNSGSNVIPVGHIVADRTSGTQRLTVQLDGTTSTDADGRIISYAWSWDDGVATGARPRITFGEGEHEVILTVMDDTGAKSTDRITITVLPKPIYTEFWLEAECARFGRNWSLVKTAKAAGGSYLEPLHRSTSSAPADAPGNYVRFTIREAKEAEYTLFARVHAPSNVNDSYWLRVNGGKWYAWKSGIAKGSGFRWNELPFNPSLRAGSNTIDIAYREQGTHLDKLYLTTGDERPKGYGKQSMNCAKNTLPLAAASSSEVFGTAPLRVTLDGSASVDEDGTIEAYDWSWPGGSARGVNPSIILPEGRHAIRLTVTDDSGGQDSDLIYVVAEAPPAVVGNGSYWLEAECAELGARWSVLKTGTASNGKYAVVEHGNSYNAPPTDGAARARFTLGSEGGGTYTLFARIDAPSNLDDSYWVRINDGGWFKWFGGIKQAQGFQWNKYPKEVNLRPGSNTIDVALREDGARLDKLHLTPGGVAPSGTGPIGSNCSYRVALEAECVTVGSGWQQEEEAGASSDKFVVFTGDRNTKVPTTNVAAQQLRFGVTVPKAGTHHLFVRLHAPDPAKNSVWIKVDNGQWIRFWEKIGGDQLLTDGFEWHRVNRDGERVTFDLSAGAHTIYLANREPGTRIDKLILSSKADLPSAEGIAANNCGSPKSMSGSTGSMPPGMLTTAEPAPEAPAIQLYPNPTVGQLNLTLNSTYRGPVEAIVTDLNGRRLSVSEFSKPAQAFTTRIEVSNLPAGMYLLRVFEGDRRTVRQFIRR